MQKLIFLSLLCITAVFGYGQNVDLRGDSIRVYKSGGYAEFVLRNKTKDSLGFLYNKGNGVTEFRSVKNTASSFIHGIVPGLLYLGSDGSAYTTAHPIIVDSGGGSVSLKFPINGSIILKGRETVAPNAGVGNGYWMYMTATDSAGRIGIGWYNGTFSSELGSQFVYTDFDSTMGVKGWSGIQYYVNARSGANHIPFRLNSNGSAVFGAAGTWASTEPDYDPSKNGNNGFPYTLVVVGSSSMRDTVWYRKALGLNTISVGFLARDFTSATNSTQAGTAIGPSFRSEGQSFSGGNSIISGAGWYAQPNWSNTLAGINFEYKNGIGYFTMGAIEPGNTGTAMTDQNGGLAHFAHGYFYGLSFGYQEHTGAFTIGNTSNLAYYHNCTSGTFTITMPTAPSLYSFTGATTPSCWKIANTGAGVITLNGGSTNITTLTGSTATTFTLNSGKWVEIRGNAAATAWVILAGN